MTTHPDDRFNALAQSLGFDFSGEIKIGGHYVPVVQHQQTVYAADRFHEWVIASCSLAALAMRSHSLKPNSPPKFV